MTLNPTLEAIHDLGQLQRNTIDLNGNVKFCATSTPDVTGTEDVLSTQEYGATIEVHDI